MSEKKKDRIETSVEYWEEGDYGTDKIVYDTDEANEEAEADMKKFKEDAIKRGEMKKSEK
jgi:hypothetical protein